MGRKRRLKLPGYRIKKCRVCGVPFLLGPLDPDVDVCPLHAYVLLAEGKLSKKEYVRLKRYASRRKIIYKK
jgi:hypothetical protein